MSIKNFWIYYNSVHIASDFCVDEFGWHNSDPEYAFQEKRINYIIQFVVKGKCLLTVWEGVNKKEYEVKEGEAFVMFAGTQHRYVADFNEGCARYWLSISGKRAEEALFRCGIKPTQVVYSGFDSAELAKRFHKFYKCIRSDGDISFSLLSNASALLDMVMKVCSKASKFQENAVSERELLVTAVMHYIENNLGEKLNIKDIAYKFGYERSYLYRIFLEEKGYSLQRYILVCRINRARFLLVETDKPVHEIVHEVGYESYASFSRVFIRETGLTPSNYRKYNSYR